MNPSLDIALFGACVLAIVVVDFVVQQMVGVDRDRREPWKVHFVGS